MQRILVIAPSWVGDCMLMQPMLQRLKQRHRQSRIDVFAPPWTERLLRLMPEVSEVILNPFPHGALNLGARRALGRQLRANRYDQVIVLPNSLKSALVPFFAGIPRRTGFVGESRYLLLNDARKLDKQKLPLMVERFASLAEDKGHDIPRPLPAPHLEVSTAQRESTLKKLGLSSGKPVAVFCPGAEYGPAKRWPEAYYAELARTLHQRGYAIWLLGSGKDKAVADQIDELSGHLCHNLCGSTDLTDAVALLACADWVASNDSGLMHLAAALDRPMVAIFGSSSPQFTPPLSPRAKVLKLDLSCSPCFKRECPLGHFNCMLQLKPEAVAQHIPLSEKEKPMQNVPKEIFKAYDIRGIVGKSLTAEVVEAIGHAIGSEGAARGQKAIVIGRDGRLSGPEFAQALARGIQKSGLDVIDIGMVATPMTYFAAYELGTHSAVMITGSHNPPDYNGLKMVLGGETLSGDTIQGLRQRIESGDLSHGAGSYSQHDITEAYLNRIVSDIKLARPLKITVDSGNGVPGNFGPELYRRLGCEVTEMFCEVDGNFPNHHPDPSDPHNLEDLIAALKTNDSEIGLAFDGDGDRLGVVTKEGNIIFPDRQLMLFAADVLSRNPGAEIIFDVKSTRNLFSWIREHGGQPTLWKTGHSLIKAKMKETGALLAGEMSGHVFFKERWYGFDDGLYAGARLLEYLSKQDDVNATLNGLPNAVCTPELQIKLQEGENYALIAELQKSARFTDAKEVISIDGLRVEYADGFGLMRSSNTTPVIVLRFEADDAAALQRIQDDFRRVLLGANPALKLPF
jgi:phosphomannomutase/phosphoglucomutase